MVDLSQPQQRGSGNPRNPAQANECVLPIGGLCLQPCPDLTAQSLPASCHGLKGIVTPIDQHTALTPTTPFWSA